MPLTLVHVIFPALSGRRRMWRSLAVFFLGAAVILLSLWMALPAILDSAARHWVVSDALKPADTVVILGGQVDTRPYAAARLFRAGLAGRILVSTGGLPPAGHTEEDDLDVLAKLGISVAAVELFGDRPVNTYEEARAFARWAQHSGAGSVIIPVRPFETRRVAWIFHRALDPLGVRVQIEAVGSRDAVARWWQDRGQREAFEREALKYVYYRIRYAWS